MKRYTSPVTGKYYFGEEAMDFYEIDEATLIADNFDERDPLDNPDEA